MQTTINTPITLRRTALTGTIAALAASMAASRLAKASTAICMDDAALIRACRERVEAEQQMDRLCQRRMSIVTEQQTETEMTALLDHIHDVEGRIENLPLPTTPAGYRALVRAALATADRNGSGDIIAGDFATWAAWSALEALDLPDA